MSYRNTTHRNGLPTLRPYTGALRKMGFVLASKNRMVVAGKPGYILVFTQTKSGRELQVQLWPDGYHRVSHGTGGFNNTTLPTDFTTLAGMQTAIALQWVIPSGQ